MKNTFNISIIPIIFTVITLSSLFYSCKKDKDVKATITVKYLSDTTKLVNGALVEIYPDKSKLQNPANSIIDTVKGLTDPTGQFTANFKEEAILDVSAQKGQFVGQTIIRLKAGKTVTQTVYLH